MSDNLAVGIGVGAGLTAAGLATCAVTDRIIDVTMHDHGTWAYKAAGYPTRVLFGLTVAALGAGLIAKATNHDDVGNTLLAAGAGAGAAFYITLNARLAYGMLVSPTTFKPNVGDIASNALNRMRMMGVEPNVSKLPLFNWLSKVQGHGELAARPATDWVKIIPR